MLEITPRQRMLLAYFRALDGTMQVEWDAARGVMARLAGHLLDPVTGPGEAERRAPNGGLPTQINTR